MATSEREEFLKLCSIRELFSGRFDDEEIAFLLQRFNGDQQDTINFILSSESQEVRRLIDEERQSWTKVLPAEKKRNLPSKIDVLRQQPQSQIMERARSGRVDTSCRMFACKNCDLTWWRKVPDRKPVSKCYRCRVRYDALPREEEYGWATFECPGCQNHFSDSYSDISENRARFTLVATCSGWCAMWGKSPCYNCNMHVIPTHIVPQTKRKPPTREQQQRVQRVHMCSAPDCSARMYVAPGRGYNHYVSGISGSGTGARRLPMTCVYPSGRRSNGLPIVVVSSEEHDGTGSTVDTFLPQDDLKREFEIIPLESISEHEDD